MTDPTIVKVEYIRTNSKDTAHCLFRVNTLVEFEPNRANGFLGNRNSESMTEPATEPMTEFWRIIVRYKNKSLMATIFDFTMAARDTT